MSETEKLNVRLSDLPPETGNRALTKNSLFLISEFNEFNGIYSSKKCNFDQLSSTFIRDIEKTGYVSISAEWHFTGLVTDKGVQPNTLSCISIKTFSINQDESVINEEYVSANFSALFNKLSADLFGKKFILPSYVGQIILGTTLKNENIIKKYYGVDTRWVQLPGRFLLPVTRGTKGGVRNGKISNVNVNIVGSLAGSSKHTFTIKDLNTHSHKFEPIENDKKIQENHTYRPIEEGTKVVNVVSTDDVRFYSTTYRGEYPATAKTAGCYTATPIPLVFSGGFCSPLDRQRYTSTGIYGKDKPNKIQISPIGSKLESKSFTKLPPFYSVYMWKRIS